MGSSADEVCASCDETLSALIDTNVLMCHLTGDPPEMAARATAYLSQERELLLTDLVAVETVYVLESFYEAPRGEVAQAVRSLLAFDSVVCVDPNQPGRIGPHAERHRSPDRSPCGGPQ